MRRNVSRLLLLLLTACCLLCIPSPALNAEGEEEPTVEEIRKKIKDALEEAEEAEEEQQPYDDDDEEGCGFFWQLFGEIVKILFLNSLTVGYADYPYAARQAVPFAYQTIYVEDPDYTRGSYASLCLDGAYLQQDRWSAAGRLSFNILPLHLHGYTQVLFDPTATVTFFSANAGLTVPSQRIILNAFLGVFGTDLSPRGMLSYGASLQVFLPGKLILDAYNINAAHYSLAINYLSVSLNRCLGAVNLGLGFNLNHYAGTLLMGPLIRIAYWM